MDFAISSSCCENEVAVLPRSPLNAVDGRLALDLVGKLPNVDLDFLPNFDEPVVAAGGDYVFKLGMGPADLPARTRVGLEPNWLLNDLVLLHSANLYLSVTVTRGQSGAVGVELGISLQ